MQSDRSASANGHPVSPSDGSDSRTEFARLQAMCRHQAVVIDTLSDAVSSFRRGATALKAENAELRAELVGLRDRQPGLGGAAIRLADGELAELVMALDTRAPGEARAFVVACLERRVAMSVLDSAQLVVSELVTNSLRHGRVPTGEVVVSVELMPEFLRVGVHDSGSDALIARTTAGLRHRGWVRAQSRADAQRAVGRRAVRRGGHAGLGAAPADTTDGRGRRERRADGLTRGRRPQAPAPSCSRGSDRAPSPFPPQGVDAPGSKSALGRRRDG